MAAAKGKVGVSSEIPVELREQLDARAKAEGRSRAETVERAIRFFLERAPEIHRDYIPDVTEFMKRKPNPRR